MSILVGLHHATRYNYDIPVALGPQQVRLRPAPHCRTRIPSYSLKVTPTQHFVNWQQDPHGNWIARFVFPERTTEFSVTVDLTADLQVINPFDFFVEPYAEKWPFTFPGELREDLSAYVDPEPAGPLLQAFLDDFARAEDHHRFPGRAQSAPAADGALRHPHGARRADAGSDTGHWLRLLPRQRVADGADPASHRIAGAVRLRLSHPAQAGREIARRPLRRRAGFHRPARLDRSLSSRRRLDRARPDLGASMLARAICRSRRRRITARPRRSPGWSSRATSPSSST